MKKVELETKTLLSEELFDENATETVIVNPIKKEKYDNSLFTTIIPSISSKTRLGFEQWDETTQKNFQPIIVQRWISGCVANRTEKANQILKINNINKYTFSLYNHKELLYKLQVAASTGRWSRCEYPKNPTSVNLNPIINVLKRYYKYSTRVASKIVNIHTGKDILQFAEDLCITGTELKTLKTAIKNYYG